MNYVYFTATLDAAVWGAELAGGDGRGHIYMSRANRRVRGRSELDLDKKLPARGNPVTVLPYPRAAARCRPQLVDCGSVIRPRSSRPCEPRLDEIAAESEPGAAYSRWTTRPMRGSCCARAGTALVLPPGLPRNSGIAVMQVATPDAALEEVGLRRSTCPALSGDSRMRRVGHSLGGFTIPPSRPAAASARRVAAAGAPRDDGASPSGFGGRRERPSSSAPTGRRAFRAARRYAGSTHPVRPSVTQLRRQARLEPAVAPFGRRRRFATARCGVDLAADRTGRVHARIWSLSTRATRRSSSAGRARRHAQLARLTLRRHSRTPTHGGLARLTRARPAAVAYVVPRLADAA